MRILNFVRVQGPEYGTEIAREIGGALRALGHEVADFNWPVTRPNIPAVMARLEKGLAWLLSHDDPMIVTSFQDIYGWQAFWDTYHRTLKRQGQPEIPSFNHYTDDPYRNMSRMMLTGRLSRWGLNDRRFVSTMKLLRSRDPSQGLRSSFIAFPAGGPNPVKAPIPIKDRDIDILFVGNCDPQVSVEELVLDRYPEHPEMLRLVKDGLAALGEGMTALDATLQVLDRSEQHSTRFINSVRHLIELYGKISQRVRVLEALKGHRVTVLGRIDPDALGFENDFTFLDTRPYAECRELTRQAKIVVNPRACFPNGAAEPTLFGFAGGSCVLTNQTTLFDEDPPALKMATAAHSYEGSDAGDAVSDLQGRIDRGLVDQQAIAGAYAETHTWTRRFETMQWADPAQGANPAQGADSAQGADWAKG